MPTSVLRTLPLLCLGWVISASTAGAQDARRVAVDRFGGPQGSQMRNLLVQDLEENGYEVVGASELRDTARETVGHTRLRGDDYPAVAQALNVVAFIKGNVRRARRRWTLRVSIHNGADGMRLGTSSWGGRTVASLRSIRRNGFRRLQEYLDVARAPAGAGQSADTPPPEQQATVADPNATPWYATGEGQGEGEGEGEEDEDEDEDEDEGEPSNASELGYPKLRFDLLLGVVHRAFGTSVLVDPRLRSPFPTSSDTNGDGLTDFLEEDRTYNSRGIGHGELGFALQVHPGMFADDPVVPWLALRIQYRHSVLLRSEGFGCLPMLEPPAENFPTEPGDPPPRTCPPTDTVPVETSQDELFAGLVADFNAGDDPAGPWIRVDAGYGLFRFRLEPRDLSLLERPLIIPPMDYSYIHTGLGARYGVHELVQIGASFAYRFGLGVGDDARAIWGAQTGGANGFLIGLQLDHHMTYLSEGVHVALLFDYFRFKTNFRGETSCNDGFDNCPEYSLWEPWTPGGGPQQPVADKYFRLGLSIGYVYD